jgi:Chitobiase/beta-hexosaminidase C-terminal domain
MRTLLLTTIILASVVTGCKNKDDDNPPSDAGSGGSNAGAPSAGTGGTVAGQGGSNAGKGGTGGAGKGGTGGTVAGQGGTTGGTGGSNAGGSGNGGTGGNVVTGGTGGSVAGNGAPRTDGCPDGSPIAINHVRILPGAGQASAIVGAVIQGSNSGPTTNFVDLTTVKSATDGQALDLYFENSKLFRYLRYFTPTTASQGAIAELEFYRDDLKLGGTPFGTAGVLIANVFDGDSTTESAVADAGGGYVGLDIGVGYTTASVTFTPASGARLTATEVSLSSATSGASIFYSLDGSDPTVTYTAPFTVSQTTTVRAYASATCLLDSLAVQGTFTIGQAPVTGGLRTYHIGNSLTDTINPWLKPIADSTGVTHTYARWTIPGSSIQWMYDHKGTGFADPNNNDAPSVISANDFDNFLPIYTPLDHMSLQPYNDYFPPTQGQTAAAMFNQAQVYSPNMQSWVYAQWPGQTNWPLNGVINYDGYVWQATIKATTWEESVEVSRQYFETFRDYIDPLTSGKSVLIVPAHLAMLEAKKRIDAGQIPGFTGATFFADFFADDEHLNIPGQYLVSLTFYSCFYQQSPEDRVTSAGTNLTAAQAKALQSLAWDTVKGYPLAGIPQ